jgi:CRISPR/Cas system CSM-associated protein Csm2 small subunit
VELWVLVLGLSVLALVGGLAVWLVALRVPSDQHQEKQKTLSDSYEEAAKQDVEHIFNDEFREELRNRGRLHFEKIITDNAMFLQQDLRLTTSQVNEFMKDEITRTLKEEFGRYEESINDAKQLAIESIEKTRTTIEQQRELLTQQLTEQLAAEKARQIGRFEEHMADVINHYLVTAVGNQIDLNDQLEYIIGDLDANKNAILEDIKNGA